MNEQHPLASLMTALRFAAEKHRTQRRKDSEASPYINHVIEVAYLLATTGGVTDVELLHAAILHDTVEDTDTTPEEIEKHFGAAVKLLVQEVTDDKNLPKAERKRLQVEHAPSLSERAKMLKLADKISNITDLTRAVPEGWSLQRCQQYIDWGQQVVAGCRGVNAELEGLFDRVAAETRQKLLQRADAG